MKIAFSELDIGVRFFDPMSGDFWVKISEEHARMEHNFDEGIESFDLNEIVIVD